MDAVDVLMEARAYVDKGWCQGVWGRKADGEDSSSDLADADMWCISGALMLTAYKNDAGRFDDPDTAHGQARHLFCVANNADSPMVFNDAPTRTKEEVLEAFDRAISLGLREVGDR